MNLNIYAGPSTMYYTFMFLVKSYYTHSTIEFLLTAFILPTLTSPNQKPYNKTNIAQNLFSTSTLANTNDRPLDT